MDHLRGRADHKHPSARIHRPQIAYEREAVPVGQPAVEERNVYASFEHRAGFGQRTRLTHHLQVRLYLQQADEGHPEVGAVVYTRIRIISPPRDLCSSASPETMV